MAPSFLSKFVRAATPTHTRDRSSAESPRPSGTTSPLPASRSRAASTTAVNQPQPVPPVPPVPSVYVGEKKEEGVPNIVVERESSSTLNVTVVPPSPLVRSKSLSDSDHSSDQLPNSANQFILSPAPSKRRTANENDDDDGTPTQTPTTPRPRSRPPTPSASSTNLANGASAATSSSNSHTGLDSSAAQLHKQPSSKSLKQPQTPAATSTNSNMPSTPSSAHIRAATAPADAYNETSEPVYASMSPIVESPTSTTRPTDLPDNTHNSLSSSPETYAKAQSSTSLAASRVDTFDTRSIMSTGEKDKKLSGWRRGSTNARKPTGLASAIAASGLAMANPTLSAAQQAKTQATINSPPPSTTQLNGTTRRKSSGASSPPYMRSPPGSSNHVKSRSTDLSPRSTRSKRSGSGSAKSPRRMRTPSVSVGSDNNSEYYPEDRPEYYSGLEEGSSGEESSDEDDDLMDLDLGEDDIPVTGFAVASNKRNADFHELFPSIPEGDYLIEDYGCALQREILIQGRLYISENHICFHANIFGWITDLSIPIYEIVTLEKKMTAFVIPNAIQISTRQVKYTFASFLSRDTTYDVIYNIWRLAKPDDLGSMEESREEVQEVTSGSPPAAVKAAAVQRRVTQCACGREKKHYAETAMDIVLPGTPDRIQNLMFASGFIKDFMAVNQKLMDIQMSDWTPISPGSTLLTRNFSYIKPLNGSLGPKQTKCELKDEMVHFDPEDYISMNTTTRTPDVPSGGVFSVKTRTCLTWASAVSTKVVVTTEVEWTGRSFIKSIIERSAIDGQKTYHIDLEKAMRGYIQEHMSEFIPEGLENAALVEPEPEVLSTEEKKTTPEAIEEEKKQREHERNQRGLQWAWDTFEGAYEVARRSTIGALELVKDAWEQSTSTTILYFVIVLLVFSNLWTLTRIGSREEAGRRKEMKKIEEREKWVQGVVTALWEELSAGKREMAGVPGGYPYANPVNPPQTVVPSPAPVVDPGTWKKEVEYLHQALDSVEARVKTIRETLGGFDDLNKMD